MRARLCAIACLALAAQFVQTTVVIIRYPLEGKTDGRAGFYTTHTILLPDSFARQYLSVDRDKHLTGKGLQVPVGMNRVGMTVVNSWL